MSETRPCWLCAFPNTRAGAKWTEGYACEQCLVVLDLVYPLRRPLTGPAWLWSRPDTTTSAAVFAAVTAWMLATEGNQTTHKEGA